MRVALLGCGRVAEHYKKMLIDIDPVDKFDVVGVCDVKINKAEKLATWFDAKAFSDVEEMISVIDINVLFVLTPSGNHFEHAKLSLNSGINVVCEKPITMKPEEAIELDTLAKKKGLFCVTVFQNRWNPALRITKQAIESGRLKKMVTANVRLQWCREQEYYEDGWHGTWRMDGGVINQQAIHHVDALQWICGPVEAVCAYADNRMNKLEAEDTLVAIVRFKSGVLATIEATTAARPEDFEASLSLVGEGGKIQVGGVAMNKIDEWSLTDQADDDLKVKDEYSIDVPTGYGLSHSPYMRDLVRCYYNKELPGVSINSAIKTLKMIHALYASVEQKTWVYLDQEPRSKKLGESN